MSNVKSLESKHHFESFVDRFDNFLFDCDGVIWHGDRLIEGVHQVLDFLRRSQKRLIFVTNNATKSREALKAKFDRLGIQVDLDEIFGSAYATALYLKRILNFPDHKKVYVIGEKGLEDELTSEKIRYSGGTHPTDNQFIDLMDFSSIQSDAEVGAVICGFDMHINYKKIAKAHRYLLENEGCHFILTNDDSTFPTDGSIFPGSGAISAPLRYAMLGKKDPIVVGKPNQAMLDCILEKFASLLLPMMIIIQVFLHLSMTNDHRRYHDSAVDMKYLRHHLDRSRSCMIGDRLDTDISFGINGQLSTLLVLTGVVTKADLNRADAKILPEFVVNSLGDLAVLST